MFDTTSNTPQTNGAGSSENAPTTFESLEYGATAIEAGKLKPVTPETIKDTGVPGDDVGVYEFQAPNSQSKIVMIAFLVLGVAALAGLAWWAYSAYTTSHSQPVVTTTTETTTEETAVDASPFGDALVPVSTTTPNTVNVVSTSSAQQIDTVSAATDTDGDGLTDADEILAGSDPRVIDSDADGLTDREEVLVYGTNPVNPDSDGDTYPDGVEVKNGYNPKGTGTLLKVSATSTKAVAP